ncbi:erythromycin esterase [Amycolatopsis antarctica]|uniref:Erythromycin esterase n=1 Tax=Amycolatopsis antarctica TaxID=1854586 RepID=A0A263D7V3_9PSEU|nr:erythromycin esterase family protein [Amycolatopsis antarctica]OZM74078.1 erythromycin esterase [Amycolatopsis antarctica]
MAARTGSFAPAYGLDDDDALRALIGDAHVVAIGENNHHIAEFSALRDRLLRFLVRDMGFGVLGFESGFVEGALVDDWIHGGPGELADVARDGFTFSLGDSGEMHTMLRWLREHNADGGRVRYAGLDVAASAGSPAPSLHAVRDFLRDTDPPSVSIVDEALAATEPYSAVSSAVSPGRYAALDRPVRDRATAAVSRVLSRLDTLAPRLSGDPVAFAIARHHAIGAVRLDAYLAEVDALMTATASAVSGSSRDTYMAETVRLLRTLHGPDERIVLMMHNGHLQRVPVPLFPGHAAVSAGTHLAAGYGEDYLALAITAGSGSTTGLEPTEGTRLGFTVTEEPLSPPAEGSVEATMAGEPERLLDLRAARRTGGGGPRGIRHATMNSDVEVTEAFDALVYLPYMQVTAFVRAAQ